MDISSFLIFHIKNLTHFIRVTQLKYQLITNSRKLKIIVGAGSTKHKNWISTNYPILNLADASTFSNLFGRLRVKAILAEHVWEHLTAVDCVYACRNCFNVLQSGGYMRIAVPDGFHPDENYISQVKPGGCGLGSDDHKFLYNYKTLSKILEDNGFKVKLLEWFDDEGQFHFVSWLPEDGFILRSTRFDERNKEKPTTYTSLIVDAIKP